MSSRTGDATTNTYELTCNDCAFEATVEGTPFDALDVADRHQEDHGETSTDHFVNCKLESGSE